MRRKNKYQWEEIVSEVKKMECSGKIFVLYYILSISNEKSLKIIEVQIFTCWSNLKVFFPLELKFTLGFALIGRSDCLFLCEQVLEKTCSLQFYKGSCMHIKQEDCLVFVKEYRLFILLLDSLQVFVETSTLI